MSNLNSIELFAGAGGLAYGIEKAGFATRKVVEKDKWACETLQLNSDRFMRELWDSDLSPKDAQKVDYSSLEGKLDLVSGGPPCQPFSLGGRHQAQADSRDMFPEAIRAVRESCPRAFIFENVKGLTRSTFSSYFEYIRLQMTYPAVVAKQGEDWQDHLQRLDQHHNASKANELSYNLNVRVLNAANYGVPQKRERVFFVGFRDDLNVEWNFPNETHSKANLLKEKYLTGEYWEKRKIPISERDAKELSATLRKQIENDANLAPWVTVRDALSDLPEPKAEHKHTNLPIGHFLQPGARSYPGHTGSPWDEPSKTLKAGVHGVPGGENMLRRHDGSVRYFSLRECARLQTFPDSYVFRGAWSEVMRQMGNAVPVKLAEVVASSVYAALRESDQSKCRASSPRVCLATEVF